MIRFKPSLRTAIIDALREHPGGLTKEQLDALLACRLTDGYRPKSLSPTLTFMKDAGAVERELGLWKRATVRARAA